MKISQPITAILKVILIAGLTIVTQNCSHQKEFTKQDCSPTKLNYALQLGVSNGGIIENSIKKDLSASEIDAISGATNMAVNAGAHCIINLKGHELETGLDYLNFSQTIEYKFATYSSKREVAFHQLRMPLTYNFNFWQNSSQNSRFILKAGFSVGCTIAKNIDTGSNLPNYNFTNYDVGPTLGLVIFPYEFSNKYRLGLYLDVYRGTKIYDDQFHKADGIGGSGFYKAGIVYHF